jgi:hypothetical protein
MICLTATVDMAVLNNVLNTKCLMVTLYIRYTAVTYHTDCAHFLKLITLLSTQALDRAQLNNNYTLNPSVDTSPLNYLWNALTAWD